MNHGVSEDQLCTEKESELTFFVRSDGCESYFLHCSGSITLLTTAS